MTISKKSGTPFFSVVIPTFNRWPLVGEAIESVFSQTFDSYELVVVDDGSTDDTARLIEKRYERAVRIIRQANKGVSAARNAGIASAAADWIAFLDSDDMWARDKLERQFEMIKSDPSARIIHTDEIWRRNGRRVNPGKRHVKLGSKDGDKDELFRRSLGMCLISPSSVVIHSSVFKTVGGFDESMPVCEDYDLWLRIMTRYDVLYLPEKLTIKRNAYGNRRTAAQLSVSVWGMDRFRIRSLRKLVDSGALNTGRTHMALQEIVRKAKIVAHGSMKRQKRAEAENWLAEKRRASKELAAL